jgi:hypothetical protein
MPDLFERAPSGRSRCRACSTNIEKGELRFGEDVDNPFTEGRTTLWFHVDCAALRRPEKARPLLAESEEPIAERDELLREADLAIAHPRLCRIAKVESAPSGRAHCRQCKELIDKGELRFGLEIFDQNRFNPMGFLHLGCAEAYFGVLPSARRLVRVIVPLEAAVIEQLWTRMRIDP